MTLWENLTFGAIKPDEERVKRILARMDLEWMVAWFEKPYGVWGKLFSSTDVAGVHIARALITNPEVLVVHRPTIYFDEHAGARVLALLHEFVDLRGLEMPITDVARRRPRTCVMSTSSSREVRRADMVLEVKDKRVVEKLWDPVRKELVPRSVLDDSTSLKG